MNSFFFYFTFFSFFLWTTITLYLCIKKTFQKFLSYMHALPLHVLLVLTHLLICCLSSLFLVSITFVFLFLLLFSLSITFFFKTSLWKFCKSKKETCSLLLFRWARFHMYLSLHVCPSFCFSNFPFVLFSCVFFKHFLFLFSFRNVFLLVLLFKMFIVFLTFFFFFFIFSFYILFRFHHKFNVFVFFFELFPLELSFLGFKNCVFLVCLSFFLERHAPWCFLFSSCFNLIKKKKLALLSPFSPFFLTSFFFLCTSNYVQKKCIF